MSKRKSMSGTAPKGVDAFFPSMDPPTPQPVIPPTSSPSPVEPDVEENIKTTVYITPEQRDYMDSLRYKMRNKMPGLTRSAVIRLALDTLAQMDENHVSAELLRLPDITKA